MATIYLHDTGKLTTTSSTTLTSSGDVANAGIEIPLKIRTLRFSVGLNFDNSPQPASYTQPKLAFISIPSPIITITGHINKNADVSSSSSTMNKLNEGTPTLTDESGTSTNYEVKMLGLLEHASRTKGYKELYYKDTGTDNLFYGLATDTEIDNSTYKCFNVRVKGIDINQSPDSELIVWNCTLEITK